MPVLRLVVQRVHVWMNEPCTVERSMPEVTRIMFAIHQHAGWMTPLAMLTIGMKVAPMLTRAVIVWMRPVAMLMIGMMLTLRVTRACRSS